MTDTPKASDLTQDPALRARFEAFANDPQTTDMHSPTGLSARGRKAWHLLAANFGLSSASVGEGLHRVVRVPQKIGESGNGVQLQNEGLTVIRHPEIYAGKAPAPQQPIHHLCI